MTSGGGGLMRIICSTPILGCLEDTGPFEAAHKSLFFDIEISWCGNVFSGSARDQPK